MMLYKLLKIKWTEKHKLIYYQTEASSCSRGFFYFIIAINSSINNENYIPLVCYFVFRNTVSCSKYVHRKRFKAQVNKTKSLGRDGIIKIAAKSISNNPKYVIEDNQILISVFYNKIRVKVDFKILYPIKYIPNNTKYFYEVSVDVVENRVIGKKGPTISNMTNESLQAFSKINLYLNTKNNELKIKEVFKLNNTNDKKYFLDIKQQQRVTIKEQEKFYEMQLGDSYPVTYKIDKISGKIYDYNDLYIGLYPTPAHLPIIENPIEGKWIEMKE